MCNTLLSEGNRLYTVLKPYKKNLIQVKNNMHRNIKVAIYERCIFCGFYFILCIFNTV